MALETKLRLNVEQRLVMTPSLRQAIALLQQTRVELIESVRHELEENPRAALLFYWGELERQVRVEGTAARIAEEESDAYFASRPLGSRLGAIASEQSRVVDGRAVLENRVKELERRYEGRDVPRPGFWGGYRVEPEVLEFWQGRENRLHDRIAYRRGYGGWGIERLQP